MSKEPKLRDGLVKPEWIKQYRNITKSTLVSAVDAWKRGDHMPTKESVGYRCTIVEADFLSRRIVIEMEDDAYAVGAGLYRLVRA